MRDLSGQMGIDMKYIEVVSVYEGSIVIVFDLKGDENVSVEELM